jgi:hypothetical protein
MLFIFIMFKNIYKFIQKTYGKILAFISAIIGDSLRAVWLNTLQTPIGIFPVLREYLALGFLVVVLVNLFSFIFFVFDFVAINFFPNEIFMVTDTTLNYNDDHRFGKFRPYKDPFGGKKIYPVDNAPRTIPKPPKPPQPPQPPFDWAAFWEDMKNGLTVEKIDKVLNQYFDDFLEEMSSDDKPMNDLEEDWADTWRYHYIKIIQDQNNSKAVIRMAKLDLENQIVNEKWVFENRSWIELTILALLFGTAYLLLSDTVKPSQFIQFYFEVQARLYFKRLGIDIPTNI